MCGFDCGVNFRIRDTTWSLGSAHSTPRSMCLCIQDCFITKGCDNFWGRIYLSFYFLYVYIFIYFYSCNFCHAPCCLHDMRLIMNECSLVCNSWVCQYPYAALMIKGYVKIFTLGCNFMLLIVGCGAMVLVYCWCHDDTIICHMDILIYNLFPWFMFW